MSNIFPLEILSKSVVEVLRNMPFLDQIPIFFTHPVRHLAFYGTLLRILKYFPVHLTCAHFLCKTSKNYHVFQELQRSQR